MVSAKGKKRIIAALSGGVDSAVAAALLCRAGNEVIGVSMRLWPKESCRDFDDARSVAAKLNIPFYSLDFLQDFKKEIVDYFYKEYLSGKTPNPCVICNNKIKFGRLWQKAKELQADYIATGHYVKAGYNKKTGRFILKEARDKTKDQSYFLFGLKQCQLAAAVFPLAGYLKPEVRRLAVKFGFRVSRKCESREICFAQDRNYADFLKKKYRFKPIAGDIVTMEGKVLGRHPGMMFFTIGQRKGLGLGGGRDPLYVADIDAGGNRIVVGEQEQINKKVFFLKGVNWISIGGILRPLRVKVKIRYNHPKASAVIEPQSNGSLKVIFEEPQFAITPGQAAVFYDKDEVLGGGWIKKSIW